MYSIFRLLDWRLSLLSARKRTFRCLFMFSSLVYSLLAAAAAVVVFVGARDI